MKFETPHRAAHLMQTEGCTGDNLENCKNCLDSFGAKNCEDCRFLLDSVRAKNCYDDCFQGVDGGEFCLETIGCYNPTYDLFLVSCWTCSGCIYCDFCHHLCDSLGCVGIRRGKNCIFNQSFSRHDYERQARKIIEHMKETKEWGEFFPMKYSPFPYNDSVAQEYFPISEEQACALELPWRKPDMEDPSQVVTDPAPDYLHDVNDAILTQTLSCERSGKAYRIQRSELEFYRRMQLPVPRICPEQRYFERMKLRHKPCLLQRTCSASGAPVLTTLLEEDAPMILSEEDYLKHLYG